MYLMDKFQVQPDPWDNRIIVSAGPYHARDPSPSVTFLECALVRFPFCREIGDTDWWGI